MKVLLSIKPEFVDKIFSGEKFYEYRKAIYNKRDIKKILIYSTKPVGMIVGEFYVEDIIEEHPDTIWERTKEYSGVKKKFYDNYFKGRKKGYAIKIGEKKIYKNPINPYDTFNSFTPPQSFLYLSDKKYSANSILLEKLAV
ncbi:MAG: ASCH domain-containing protein [Deltaproteobacteria bacterium]|nr:ASCH domain-containing protein [Deltaproteobacteria bacterium]